MITITITGDTPMEALASLVAFAAHANESPSIAEAANGILSVQAARQSAKPARSREDLERNAKVTQAVKNQTTAEEPYPLDVPPWTEPTSDPAPPVQDTTPAPTPDPTPTPNTDQPAQVEKKELTLEELRDAAIKIARKNGGSSAMKDVLKRFGAESMSALPASQYGAFMAAMEELGNA